jgi:wyosine [tRNA(Phe)-imidazoG37] synthetase (radical SAM superfamily)
MVTSPDPSAEPAISTIVPNKATAFGRPRSFLGNRFVYAVISQRARGLSVGINLTPDKRCNFDCVYCEIDRDVPGISDPVDLGVLAAELGTLFDRIRQRRLRDLDWFRQVPADLLELKEVALSGDGEPTLCPSFSDVVAVAVHRRAMEPVPFKIVLITNGTTLETPEVQRGLNLLANRDEVWVKLDVGTQEGMNRVNRATVPLRKVLENILALERKRPVIIQSLFPQIGTEGPASEEIEQYVQRLLELKVAGAKISLVQIYSAHRPAHRPDCAHLPLKELSFIAQRVRVVTGLNAEVF